MLASEITITFTLRLGISSCTPHYDLQVVKQSVQTLVILISRFLVRRYISLNTRTVTFTLQCYHDGEVATLRALTQN